MTFYDHNKLLGRTQDPASLASYLTSQSLGKDDVIVPLTANPLVGIPGRKISMSVVPFNITTKLTSSTITGYKEYIPLGGQITPSFLILPLETLTQSLDASISQSFTVSYPNKLDSLTIDFSRITVDSLSVTTDQT
jgi:hypothetical protein